MEINIQSFLIIFLAIIFVIILYQYHYYSKIENITSNIDNRNYEVQIREDAQEAANLIAQIREKLILQTLTHFFYNLLQFLQPFTILKNFFQT